MTSDSIAAVVVNHNTRVHLRACVAALLEEHPAQVIVVDTASSDGSADVVRREFPDAEVVETANRGYGAGANAGLARVRVPYALVLNADTRPTRGALAALAAYLGQNPRAAVVGPRLVDGDGTMQKTTRRFPGPFEILLVESGLHRYLRRGEDGGGRADWVLGAALALRCSAVAEIGGFDESYFMYNEEVDLCLRLRQAGWEVHHAPVATIVHVGGASTTQQRAAMAAQYVRSTLLLHRRFFSRRQRMSLYVIFSVVLTLRSLRDRLLMLLTRDRARRVELRAELAAWRAAKAALRPGR